MKKVEVSDAVYDKLTFTGQLLDKSAGEVVGLLVDRLSEATRSSTAPETILRGGDNTMSAQTVVATADWIPVHKDYLGHHVEGSFNPSTMEVRISSAPWSGKVFTAPTSAARAVVAHFQPGSRETTNTNGRKFWKVTGTGRNLHSIVGER